MCSVQSLREFISDRLTAAAEEIFTEFEKTIVQYEEEIDRQRRLLEIRWKPHVQLQLHTTDLPQQHVWKEEQQEEEQQEGLTEQQVCSQERTSSVEQPEAELPHMKVEEEELCIRQDEEQRSLKQEQDSLMVTPACEEGSRREPNKNRVLPQNPPEAEDQEDPGCSRDEELKRTERNDQTRAFRVKEEERNQGAEPDQNTFICRICQKSFSQKYKLTTHMRMHTGEMSCEICGKRYTMSRDLNAHLMSHKGEKPFVCATCGMGFTRNNRLKLHMRSHTQEKPFWCLTCGKTFSRKCYLTTHMRTHTGEQPYSCQVCGKSFSLYGNMFRHRRLHSKGKL